jgi:chemotaxis protein MotB
MEKLEKERDKNEQLQAQIEQLKAEAAKFSTLTDENKALTQEKETLTKQIDEDKVKMDELLAKIESQAKEIQSLSKKKGAVVVKKPDMSWAKGLTDTLKATFRDEIKSGDVEIKQTDDRLIITLAEPLLFERDDVEISLEGEDVLAKLGEILKRIQDHQIIIGSHFDDTPIAPSMAREFPTAWEFTGTRAIEVVRFFEEENQIGGKTLSAVAFGSARPVAGNTSEAGRAQNRRIEVSLLP